MSWSDTPKGGHVERRWTQEIDEFILARCPVVSPEGKTKLLEDVNRTFGRDFTRTALTTHCTDRRMDLGIKTWQSAGRHGVLRGMANYNHRPVGAEQVKKGYVRVKVAEPNVWRMKNHVVWERAHPGETVDNKRETVIFVDGDNRNFAPENLCKITRRVLQWLNQTKSLGDDTEKNMVNIAYAQMRLKLRDAMKEQRMLYGNGAPAFEAHEHYLECKENPDYRKRRSENAKRYRKKIKMEHPEKIRAAAEKHKIYMRRYYRREHGEAQ